MQRRRDGDGLEQWWHVRNAVWSLMVECEHGREKEEIFPPGVELRRAGHKPCSPFCSRVKGRVVCRVQNKENSILINRKLSSISSSYSRVRPVEYNPRVQTFTSKLQPCMKKKNPRSNVSNNTSSRPFPPTSICPPIQ